MTGAEFNTAVYDLLGTEGKRRGIEALRAAFIKAAVSDLSAYIDVYKGAKLGNTDLTPFDSDTAEAVAEFVSSKLALRIDRDPQLAQLHMASFVNLRRRIFLTLKEGAKRIINAKAGNTLSRYTQASLDGCPYDLTDCSAIYLIKRRIEDADDDAVLTFEATEAGGCQLEIYNAKRGVVQLRATGEAMRIPSARYFGALQITTPDGAVIEFPSDGAPDVWNIFPDMIGNTTTSGVLWDSLPGVWDSLAGLWDNL